MPTKKTTTARTSKREVPAQIAGRRRDARHRRHFRRGHPVDYAHRLVRQTGYVRRDLHRRHPTAALDIRLHYHYRCCAVPIAVAD